MEEQKTFDPKQAAEAFVELIVSNRELKNLSKDERNVLANVVRAAGYRVKRVTAGQLPRVVRARAGRIGSNVMGFLNERCPYFVECWYAKELTLWLDGLVGQAHILHGAGHRGNGYKKILLAVVLTQMEQIRPFPPIRLTSDGDELKLAPLLCDEGLSPSIRDVNNLVMRPGIHRYCGGAFHWRRVTKEAMALFCPRCGLRLVMPRTIKTYGDLRKFTAS